jgi:hypothetical protein
LGEGVDVLKKSIEPRVDSPTGAYISPFGRWTRKGEGYPYSPLPAFPHAGAR